VQYGKDGWNDTGECSTVRRNDAGKCWKGKIEGKRLRGCGDTASLAKASAGKKEIRIDLASCGDVSMYHTVIKEGKR
jgi:hypothetical protein